MSQQRRSVPADLYDEEYFLSACEGYEEFLRSDGGHLSRRLASAFALAELKPGMKVLDVGCGRGEILRHCLLKGTRAIGIDYARAAVRLSRATLDSLAEEGLQGDVAQADARHMPFADGVFDRVLMFDIVEHLYPWELDMALAEARRVLKPDGRLIIHTAPNRWYNQYAYPVVRLVRTLMGQGANYPRDPREFGVPINRHVHVNEQSLLSLYRVLRRAGFRPKVWLDSPPQDRDEGVIMAILRHVAFKWPPFRWFFEREVFAVAAKR